MLDTMSHTCARVLDQDAALAFYTDVLGFTVHEDVPLGGGARWLTVRPPGDGPQVILSDCASGTDPATAATLRELVAAGTFGVGVVTVDDCHATYDALRGRGVRFVQEPTERPYGVEAILRDDSGNWLNITEPASR